MSTSSTVYDLGAIDESQAPAPESEPLPLMGPDARAERSPRVARARRPVSAPQPNLLDPIADTLTLVLPGTGHMLRGRWAAGFALAGWVGLLSTCIWALHGSLNRLDATLPFLGYPREAGIWALGALVGSLALLHVSAQARHSGGATVAPHPVVSGVASALIPGWGQLLNGHRLKAATFVAGLWVVAASWALASQPVAALFERFDLYMPAALESFRSPLVRWTLPAVIWALALYDAIGTARSPR